MTVFESLPVALKRDVIVKATHFMKRANEELPEGEKVGMRLRDAVEVVMTVIMYEPLWKG